MSYFVFFIKQGEGGKLHVGSSFQMVSVHRGGQAVPYAQSGAELQDCALNGRNQKGSGVGPTLTGPPLEVYFLQPGPSSQRFHSLPSRWQPKPGAEWVFGP